MARKNCAVTNSRPQVALLVETSMASGRQILRGIGRYAREHGPWALSHEPGHLQLRLPDWLQHWRGNGIIARVRSREVAVALAATGLPVLDVLNDCAASTLPAVQVSNEGVARLGVEHFLERGFRQFGFCAIRGPRWSRARQEVFVAILGAAGRHCDVFTLARWNSPQWFAEAERQRLASWVAGLPKPVGILACNDLVGQRVLDACRSAGVPVPEAAAVLGVDNDESICDVSDPLLSSIVPVHDRAGYEAARLLDRWMQGEPPAVSELLIEPTEVVVRRSTDILAIEDVELAAAVRFIREHACDGIGVEDVVRQVAISYSTLKRKFGRIHQRSIHDEIIRVRLERAKELLGETDLPLAAIARKTGFEHQEYLGAVFKARVGTTPQRYRLTCRSRSG